MEFKEFALPVRGHDNTLHGTALVRWQDEIMKASRINNTAFDKPYRYRRWMEEAGFVNVKELIYSFPLNTWPNDPKLRELGLWEMVDLLPGIEGFSAILFTEFLGWSREEVEVLLANVRTEIQDPGTYAYVALVAVIGQKPSLTTGKVSG